jgi:hypothetical protein
MRIIINSITANLIDTSTTKVTSFLIKDWTIEYEIPNIDPIDGHSIRGTLKWKAQLNEYKIIKFLKWFYGKRNTTSPEPT